MRYIFLFLAFVSFSFAQPLSLGKPNEEKVHSSWLNMGFGVGMLTKDFFNPSFLLSIQFAELSALTFESDITVPNSGFGGWVGFEQQFMKTDITPFAEAQIGARYHYGPAGNLSAGVIFFRTSQFRIRIKGGYEMIANEERDKFWNAETSVLFAFGRAGLQTIKVD